MGLGANIFELYTFDTSVTCSTQASSSATTGSIELAPFSLQFIRVAHSIPEAQALVITTPYGIVLHTGDFKLDPAPLAVENWMNGG